MHVNREVLFTIGRAARVNAEVLFTNGCHVEVNAEVLFTNGRPGRWMRKFSSPKKGVENLLVNRGSPTPGKGEKFVKFPSQKGWRPGRNGVGWGMSEVVAENAPVLVYPEEKVFLGLHNAQRRHLLKRLAMFPQGLTAGEVGEGHRRQRNLMVKHLGVLQELGLVVGAENAKDGRCVCYRLAPWVVVRRVEGNMEVDFGCGVLRWVSGGEQGVFPRPLYRNRRQRR